jgi:hypothetical protein
MGGLMGVFSAEEQGAVSINSTKCDWLVLE